MSAVTTYRHFKKQDEVFMGMSFVTLSAVIGAALSLFYIAVNLKLALNSPLLLTLSIIWMIIIALIIKANSGEEIEGYYSSIFLHPLQDHLYNARAPISTSTLEPNLDALIGITAHQNYLQNSSKDLIAVIKIENGIHWLCADTKYREEICNKWSKLLAQIQSTSSIQSYWGTASNEGDTIQAFIDISQSTNRNESSKVFIAELGFYLIVKHKIQRNKSNALILWLKRFSKKQELSKKELNDELQILEQKIELCLMTFKAMDINAYQLENQSLKAFYEKHYPAYLGFDRLYDRAKYLEFSSNELSQEQSKLKGNLLQSDNKSSQFLQVLRFSNSPDSGDLNFWLIELISKLKYKSKLSVFWTLRDAHKDRRHAEQKAEIVKQLTKGSKSSTQAIINENSKLAADLIEDPQSYDLSIFVVLEAENLKDLEAASLDIVKPYSGARLSKLERQQIKNYISALPFANLKLKSSEQLFASTKFAGANFPFLKNSLGSRTGPLIGQALEDMRAIYLDEYDRSICNNRNINFIGDSGSGKTVAAKLAVKRRLDRGASFVVIDNTTDGWQFFMDYYDGKIIELDTSINSDGLGYFAPLCLCDNPSSNDINNQIERSIKLLSIIKNRGAELSVEEEFFLVKSLTKLYERNLKPSLSDLYMHWQSEISSIAANLYVNEHSMHNELQNKELLAYQKAIAPYCRCTNGIYSGLMDGKAARITDSEKLVLVTFSKVESDANFLPVALFLVMNYISQRVVFKREAALTLIVDEAWKIFTGTKAKLGKDMLSFFARAGRGMDLGLWTISQKPQDLPREVHSSASCTLCFQLKEHSDKAEIISAAGLNHGESKLIHHSALNEPGNCFIKTTRSAGLIKVCMDEAESVLTNSNRNFANERAFLFNKLLSDSRSKAAIETVKELSRSLNSA